MPHIYGSQPADESLAMLEQVDELSPWPALCRAWLLAMHFVDLYWQVMPTFHPEGVHVSALDVAAFAAVGGSFVAAVGWLMRRQALVPIRDPRLPESLAFENA